MSAAKLLCRLSWYVIPDEFCFQRVAAAAAGGKTEDFMSAAKLFYRAKRQVKVPTYLVPATQKVRRHTYRILHVYIHWVLLSSCNSSVSVHVLQCCSEEAYPPGARHTQR
jgi:hypothetical protein